MSMASRLLKDFRFSPGVTIVCLLVAAVMLRASFWQWSRYKEKLKLVATYAANSETPAVQLPADEIAAAGLRYRKVAVEGDFDFERQTIVLNRRHISGPGFWLMAPLLPPSGKAVIVSRGFIPFADGSPQSWRKYDSDRHARFEAVVQKNRSAGLLGSEQRRRRAPV